MPPLRTHVVSLSGGLQDSKGQPEPSDLREAFNLAIFRGRLALRAPVKEIATIEDDQGSPEEVTSILAMEKHASQVFIVSHSTNTNKVYLHSMSPDGTGLTQDAIVWTGVSTPPVVSMSSFEGGTAESGTARLYISDYLQDNLTRYWDGSQMQDLTVDLNNDSTEEDVVFSLVKPYNFHLWGTGFYQGGAATRPEMLRFSQPGLVPGTDPAGGENPKEWWFADHRGVGRRGNKITALSYAGGRMVVYKEDSVHVIFGYDASSWATIELSDKIGAVGPHAATTASTPRGRMSFFWSNDGPYVTDGKQIRYIGNPIRQRVIDLESGSGVVVEYSPEDGLVYFMLSPEGAEKQIRYLAFDVNNERWTEGEWLDDAGDAIEVGVMTSISSATLPDPEGDPFNLSVESSGDRSALLSWTNGDVSLSTVTHIYRSTTSGFTPGPANKVGEVGSGVNEFEDTGLSTTTTYYWVVRHFRFQQHSQPSNEASLTTPLGAPDNLVASTTEGGVNISYEQINSISDIVIERRLSTGSLWTEVVTQEDIPSGNNSYEDTTATCGATYSYRAKAQRGGFSDSSYSNESSATACQPSGDPDDPGDGEVVSNFSYDVFGCGGGEIGLTMVSLSWDQDTSLTSDEDLIRIGRTPLSGGSPITTEREWKDIPVSPSSSTGNAADQEWDCPGGATSFPDFPNQTIDGMKYSLRYLLKGSSGNFTQVAELEVTINDTCNECD